MGDSFELKLEHLMLLQRAYVYWEDAESGAPAINPKRPYGNSGVASDVAEIIGKKSDTCPHCREPLTDNREAMLKLHRETETALSIILSLQTFECGTYLRERNGWRKIA